MNKDTLITLKSASGKFIEDAIAVEFTDTTVIWRYYYSDTHYEATLKNIISINGVINKRDICLF